jgi:phospholipase C
VRRGRLPQVSWIVAPEAYTEHPNWEPDYGAWYVSQVIDILADNPEVWSRMALFLTYDEEGGFFDHLAPPTPPQTRAHGLSTVPTTNEIFPGDADHPAGPYGLGIRVPMIIISPWTRGGWVNSQVFDHTSLIRFLEARFGSGRPDLTESNITPWRRAVVGDLTSAFDFCTPNRSRDVRLPDTDDFEPVDLVRRPDQVPVPPPAPHLPGQERGVRPARALPYTVHVDGHAGSASFIVDFRNTGRAAAVFQVRSPAHDPRTYTVEPARSLTDTWDVASGYDLSVHGPNGFFRRFTGSGAALSAGLDIRTRYDERRTELILEIANRGRARIDATVRDRYSTRRSTLSLRPGGKTAPRWSLSRTRGWYDLTVTVGRTEYRYAGHLENGRDSISDPAMGGLV